MFDIVARAVVAPARGETMGAFFFFHNAINVASSSIHERERNGRNRLVAISRGGSEGGDAENGRAIITSRGGIELIDGKHIAADPLGRAA